MWRGGEQRKSVEFAQQHISVSAFKSSQTPSKRSLSSEQLRLFILFLNFKFGKGLEVLIIHLGKITLYSTDLSFHWKTSCSREAMELLRNLQRCLDDSVPLWPLTDKQ